MEALILDNSMFDDGSIECKTFCVASEDDAIVVEYSYIQKHHADLIPQIKQAMAAGKHHISYLIPSPDPLSFGETLQLREIQWD